jgi:bis(5'-nucleosyl)-tetraphosphatase (symmetrical)
MWAIGDVQGCFSELQTLVKQIDKIDPNSQLWFAGDLVNRGPESLKVLRFIKNLGQRATCVLGNHDIHLLALATGVRRASDTDTMAEVLDAADANDLLLWLRTRPLAHLQDGFLLVHAGLFPGWSIAQGLAHAQQVQSALAGPQWQETVRQLYGDQPATWHVDPVAMTSIQRLRFIVNAFTRMRYLTAEGDLDFSTKENKSTNLVPWFQDSRITRLETTVVYGHWSTQGLQLHRNTIGLDTGCVWGGSLTAVQLLSRRVLQVPGQIYQVPG